ncbi:phytoene dehydrogenase [Cokeromyces recurvatus]|uniref:phytoene dehydrogenase n=1 Tax=Cokeromyces recurvatus TaxID=90255 RepID=UPI00221F9AEE|nr:phytoene dehydrogenase [Cokeromyces recurvatus]KAI7899018.1 phytoene dehydrogenase [Cokeromyces recurvatus]
MSNKKHIVIIGAGVGGTATAARLAREGFKVTVIEKNDFSGGRCSLIHHNGYRFDQGPSLYLMPKLFEDAFADLDERIEDHLELLRCDNNYKVHFDDGEAIQLSSDLTRMKAELDRIEGPSGFGRFLDFMKETHIHYETGTCIAIKRNFETIWDLIRLKYAPEIFRLHLFDKIYERASKYFMTKKMRMAFTFQTMYMGMSPYDAPAVYSLLQYTEFAEGIWYPRGGFNMVVQKLETIAHDKYGAEFLYNCPVAKINTDDANKRVTGITLESGQVIEADAVVCNADLVYAYHRLLPSCSWTQKSLASKKLTSSSISFYWSMSTKVTQLDVHNIFLAESYKESFDEIFNDFNLPSEASFYVNVPSRIDPSAAPEGKDSIIVLVPIGHSKSKTGIPDEDYASLVKRARSMVLEVIERRLGITHFDQLIENEIVNDPSVWQSKFNLWKGSILGLSHDIFQVLWFRPSTKDSTGRYDNLFFVGASTHPGTGVPIVLAGSKLTSDQVCESFGKTPLMRKIEGGQKVSYSQEKTKMESNWIQYIVVCFIITFLWFYFFPQEPGRTPASVINNLLPHTFRVHNHAHELLI